MQAKIKQMSKPEVDDFLRSQQVGLLSLTDGQSAYGIPLGYSYDGEAIYLATRSGGRKMDYINQSRNVSFAVYWLPEKFGLQNMHYKSVVCDGKLEQIKDPDGLRKAVRSGETHLGLPPGAWDDMIAQNLKDPENSFLWRIDITEISGREV